MSGPRASALRVATPSDLADWDALAVEPPGGHVYQSRAWGEFQSRAGWRTTWLRFDDGFPVLVLRRRWPWVGGWSAYVSRGPVPTEDPEQTAERQIEVGRWLGEHGVDVIAADPEVEAASAFASCIRAAGFRPIEEIQPSRHRLRLPLAGLEEQAVFGRIAKSTRQRIRQAERAELEVVRFDARSTDPIAGERVLGPGPDSDGVFDAFYDLVVATGERLHFGLGGRSEFVPWWQAGLAAGHVVYLEARAKGSPVAGLLLYRHGNRLSTVHSADHADARQTTGRGALHLLRWRAIQLAIAEGRDELDLGGVDLPGARRIPAEGDPTYGLYEHKRSFGAEWVELAGAHRLVVRPLRYAGGRLAQRLARETRRLTGGRSDA